MPVCRQTCAHNVPVWMHGTSNCIVWSHNSFSETYFVSSFTYLCLRRTWLDELRYREGKSRGKTANTGLTGRMAVNRQCALCNCETVWMWMVGNGKNALKALTIALHWNFGWMLAICLFTTLYGNQWQYEGLGCVGCDFGVHFFFILVCQPSWRWRLHKMPPLPSVSFRFLLLLEVTKAAKWFFCSCHRKQFCAFVDWWRKLISQTVFWFWTRNDQ